jgi:arylsulfatase A-like enzyme
VDIWPTLLGLVGLAMPGEVDGRSRVPEIDALARGQAPPDTDHSAIAQLDQNWGQPNRDPKTTVAVLENEHRYVRIDAAERVEYLFDRSDDPAELKDRLEDEPEARDALAKAADDYLAKKPSWGDAPTRELGELELNQLRALGYALPAAHAAQPRQKIPIRR